MTGADSVAQANPDQVLDFWFAPESRPYWFQQSQGFDAAVEEVLAPLHRLAVAEVLEDWRESPRGALALVLLLDQVPRNLHRGQSLAFAFDARALAIADGAIAADFDQQLSIEERFFLYLPFEHSENLDDQERALALISALGDESWTYYAQRHRDIVARFGRFPHRNAALGRETTEAEAQFLKEPDSSF
ncbi:DUF924 family protein [Fodinicurvata fenggangensis]|uniref:DUF924 family protein n=1 Tax=Fodinicurvata fenggangensis TaxID=1121830 RepID=UPI00068D4B93|nr:DUF924 family protein [Fodinicurvata fenggangensis]